MKNLYLKNKKRTKRMFNKLKEFVPIIDEIKDEIGLTRDINLPDCDKRDLKSMCYIFACLDPNITKEEFKRKSKELYLDFCEPSLKNDFHETKEEQEARKQRQYGYLDTLYKFQRECVKKNKLKTDSDYFNAIVLATLNQTLGTKLTENKEYFEQQFKTLEKVKQQDLINKYSVNYGFDVTDDLLNYGINLESCAEMTLKSIKIVAGPYDSEECAEVYRLYRKCQEVGLAMLNQENAKANHLELKVIDEVIDFADIELDFNKLYKAPDYSYADCIGDFATRTFEKLIGDDSNEKSVLRDFHDGMLFVKNIFLDGHPLDYYIPDEIKNFNIMVGGKIDHSLDSKKALVMTRARAVVLFKALNDGDKHLDIVRYNKFKDTIGYQIEPIRIIANQKTYNERHHNWFRRTFFSWSIKNIQRDFDAVYNDNSTKDERYSSIKENIEKYVKDLSKEEKKEYKVREIGKPVGVKKDIPELKDNKVIDDKNINEVKVMNKEQVINK